ncbi:hypothetical protein ACNI0R_25675, partial [Escherichia coli]
RLIEWMRIADRTSMPIRDRIERNTQDIRHILRTFSLLRPGGVLVAVCLNGPRQQEKLLPFSDVREELPRGTFAYTSVPTMIIRLRA